MEKIIELLLEKNFSIKIFYREYGVLTSEQIQKVWLEASVERLISLNYLICWKSGQEMVNKRSTNKRCRHFKADAEVNRKMGTFPDKLNKPK